MLKLALVSVLLTASFSPRLQVLPPHAVTVLESNPTIKVLSFDIGWETVVFAADRYIQKNEQYSRRHLLVLADSTDTVAGSTSARARFCDIAFVDGGHFNDVAFSVIMSSRCYRMMQLW
jgi:hypothetical protein